MITDHPWLGSLFGDEVVAGLWSADTQLGHYRAFEKALAAGLAASRRVPQDQAARAIEAVDRAEIDLSSLAKSTLRDGLPLPDFVRQLRAAAGPDEKAIHTGATSQDVLDTALSLTLRDVTAVLVERVQALDAGFRRLVSAQGDAPMMGRTRMQAALPITVADRVRTWRQPLAEHAAGLDALRPRIERLQLGGAVGTRNGWDRDGEAIATHVAQALGLSAAPVWHTDRAAIADYAGRLSLVTGSLGKFGQDVALMAQQGVDEITLAGGGGSSAMPHKSNPVLAELLVTLARYNATQVGGLHHALIHEQERSGAAWMLEWMILPAMTVATARSLTAALDLCSRIERIGTPAPKA
ncbi:3-carboxy-cis,cis-muconate cycloisomerase [Ponticoccus alexandrii]|uniref:3-carboxy-cis,cis-muconate cycloisomerase n=1 Tax=Ponticoccus alexandrii TaxID=1943633 RepID=A0ABX7FDZ9_9RHOB|nr:3-carboxy-cis,cis-muconate cycloisomerase [Ponticoccus alexandrii]ETA50651.1 3-carboxy-cis,cis-muconate cycloisomerase [Rhodobacteraceae bacterium PD-2]QRF68623.1 3-carboxy-cis,cis-muconate cycloisomerase [Ponticoccus alexandrii]